MPRSGFTSRTLVFGFVAVASAFIAATATSELADVEIRRAAASIVSSSETTIYHLSAMRSSLRRFEVLLDDYVDQDPIRKVKRVEIVQLRDDIVRAWASYESQPSYTGEHDLWTQIDDRLRRLNVLVADCLDAMASGHIGDALQNIDDQIKPLVDALDDELAAVAELNWSRGRALASEIEALGRRSLLLAVVLDALCVLLTAASAALLVRAERRHRRALEERADELELFSGRVAHDILSPLNPVALSLDLIGRQPHLEDRARNALARAQNSLGRVRQLVDDLWAFARSGARPEPDAHVEVTEVVRAVADEVRPIVEQANAEIRIEPVPGVQVRCSAGVLASLVGNLVRNALTHMADARDRAVTVRVLDRGVVVRVEVEDSGPGIPAPLQGTIFEPYVRGSPGGMPGLGLGLATVKRFAERHGGRVGLESRAGIGSRFWFELPKAGPARAA
jgi:signal transduction histidine kinase